MRLADATNNCCVHRLGNPPVGIENVTPPNMDGDMESTTFIFSVVFQPMLVLLEESCSHALSESSRKESIVTSVIPHIICNWDRIVGKQNVAFVVEFLSCTSALVLPTERVQLGVLTTNAHMINIAAAPLR